MQAGSSLTLSLTHTTLAWVGQTRAVDSGTRYESTSDVSDNQRLCYVEKSDVSDRERLFRMAELEGAREGDPVEEEWSVERVLDKRVSRWSDSYKQCY